MQLSPKPLPVARDRGTRRRQLALAALALAGGTSAPAAELADADAFPPAVVDTDVLYYQENNNRITDLSVVLNVLQPLHAGQSWNARLTIDSVCGGSPIGALPSKSAQTFVTANATSLDPPVQTTTSASGGGGGGLSLCTNPVQNQKYTVAPGALPIDQSFHDLRAAFSGGYETALGEAGRLAVGGAASHETDFVSLSANGVYTQDFDHHNTSVSAGLSLEYDTINPVGGTPVAWSPYGDFEKVGNQSKTAQGALLGLTQVMTRRWITQANLSYEHSSGYQTDPYKIVSELDANGGTLGYFHESRPRQRNRVALFWDNKLAFDHDVLEASFRHTQDSWKVRSDTFEMHYRLALADWGYLEPHLRAYKQTAADFFRFYVQAADVGNGNVSADPRLAAFTGSTIGLKYGLPVGRDGELSLRAEQYAQRGSGPSSVPVGLQGLDLYPGMKAWIMQAGLRFSF